MNNKGFTLIEVLAVLVILSIIMGLALPAFTSTMERSKKKNDILYKEKVLAAAELYVADYKYEMYARKGEATQCLIRIEDLLRNGYFLPSEVKPETKGVIYSFDNHEYTFLESDSSDARCIEEDE